jgi:hypothetical protein
MKLLIAKRRVTILLSIAFIAAMLFLTTSAWSQATRYCVENDTVVWTVDPGPSWFNGMVYHERSWVSEGESTGDIVADLDYTGNFDLNVNTYRGHLSGKQALLNVEIEVDGEIMEGGFDGLFNASYFWFGPGIGGEWEGDYIANGSGDFEGMKLIQSVTGSGSPTAGSSEEYIGYILDPKGKLPDKPCD